MDNSSVILEDTARRSPDRDALVQGDTRTCTQMNAAAKRVANLDDSGARSSFCFQGTAENERAEITGEELVAWAEEQLASLKYPRVVEFGDNLQMIATGKILEREPA